MNRRHFLKRAVQAAASVSAAAVVGREVGGDWESDDYSHFITDADGWPNSNLVKNSDFDIKINDEKFKLVGRSHTMLVVDEGAEWESITPTEAGYGAVIRGGGTAWWKAALG